MERMKQLLLQAVCFVYVFKGSPCLKGGNVCKPSKNAEIREEEFCCRDYREHNGRCIPCPEGSFGVNCSEVCPLGFYGPLCRQRCSCATMEVCLPTLGCTSFHEVLDCGESSHDDSSLLEAMRNKSSTELEQTFKGVNQSGNPFFSSQDNETNFDGINCKCQDFRSTTILLIVVMTLNICILLIHRITARRPMKCCYEKHSAQRNITSSTRKADNFRCPESNHYYEI